MNSCPLLLDDRAVFLIVAVLERNCRALCLFLWFPHVLCLFTTFEDIETYRFISPIYELWCLVLNDCAVEIYEILLPFLC